MAGNVEKGEAPTFLREHLGIRLDENLDGLFAGVNLDTNRCVAEIDLVSSSVRSSNDGVGHRRRALHSGISYDALSPRKSAIGRGFDPAFVIEEVCGYLPQTSGKLPDTHSVGSFCDNNLGVFMIIKIATENTDAVPPAHPVPRTPKAACPGLHRGRAPRVPLTRLARLTTGQSLCTGHVDASLEKVITVAVAQQLPEPLQ